MRKEQQASFRQRFDAVAQNMDRALDIPFIYPHLQVGLDWSSMSAQQQQQFLEPVRDYTIASLPRRFETISADGPSTVLPDPRQLTTPREQVA